MLPQLKEAGVAFGADGSYQLTTDSFKFREHLKRTMKRNDARDELIQGLADSWEDASSLRQALSPMRMPAGAATSAGDGVKDSLVRMLLQVDPLQTELANMLFEKLGELQADMDTDGNSMPLPRLIISQFRWLEHVVDGEALINSVSQTLQVSRPPLHVHSPPLRRVAESPSPELSASCHASHGVCHASHNAPKPPHVGAGARLARADGAPARPLVSSAPRPAQVIDAPLQKELILVLPDLVTDDQHAAAVDMLSELLRKDNQFTAPVLDSLGSLQLNPAMLKQVNDTVTESVASANPQDLPMVIRFLLQHMTAGQHAKGAVVAVPQLATPAARGLLSSTASALGCPTHPGGAPRRSARPRRPQWQPAVLPSSRLISSLATRRRRRPRTSSARCAAGWGSTCSSRTATRRRGPASPAARRWCSTPCSRRCGSART